MSSLNIDACVEFLNSQISGKHDKPTVGVICGSGLSGLASCLSNPVAVQYEDIPGFPRTTIEGHLGELVFGKVDEVSVVLMRGRFHSYEGYDMHKVTAPVKVMRGLGVEYLIVTNAAGGINRQFNVGDVMIMNDHIGFPLIAGKHPLLGPNDTRFGGPRFVPTSDSYDLALQQLVWETAVKLRMENFVRRSGMYAMVSGPSYESAGESNMLRTLGADAVGMSTVPEVVVARHCGMKVIGLSLITNAVVLPGDLSPVASHEEVLETVKKRGEDVQMLVSNIIATLAPKTLNNMLNRLTEDAKKFVVLNTSKKSSSSSLKSQLLELNLNDMTPMEALVKLNELQKVARESS